MLYQNSICSYVHYVHYYLFCRGMIIDQILNVAVYVTSFYITLQVGKIYLLYRSPYTSTFRAQFSEYIQVS